MQATQPTTGETNGKVAISGEASEKVYVWEWPIRVTHWVTVISIGILTVTGLYMVYPFMGTTGPAINQFMLGSIRFTHFVTAFVFTASVLLRLYWAFVGNRFARWSQLLPFKSARRRGIRRMMFFYLFLRQKAPAVIGHNPLAGMAYTVVFTLFLLQIITGFALYSIPFHGGIWPTLFGWIIVVFGVQPVKLAHDLIMWFLLAFAVHHIYTAILIDMEERSGIMSSIFTGYKHLTKRQLAEAREEETPDAPRSSQRTKSTPREGNLDA